MIYGKVRSLFEKVVDALNFELQMNEIMSNTLEKKKTTPRYDNSFKKSWTSSYPFIKASRKGVTHCFCELCRSDFSINHGGLGWQVMFSNKTLE
jgi:hypothetical protein